MFVIHVGLGVDTTANWIPPSSPCNLPPLSAINHRPGQTEARPIISLVGKGETASEAVAARDSEGEDLYSGVPSSTLEPMQATISEVRDN